MTALDERIQVPPDESFWQRYSPRHEFPLASVVSIFAHGAVIGVLIGAAFWFSQLHTEANRPPLMDVVMVDNGGDGSGPPGGEFGGGDTKTELTPLTPKVQPKELFNSSPVPQPLLVPSLQLDPFDPQTDLLKELEFVEKDAKRIQEVKDSPKSTDKVQRPIMPGVDKGKPGGGDGKAGSGVGRKGPPGGLGSKALTKQEIYANRWRFDLSGSPREHVDKLIAAGVILALPDNRGGGGVLILRDFTQRPARPKLEDVKPFQDAVKWYNNNPQSLKGLAQELGLRPVPNVVAMLLPKAREQKMADEEARFARENGRDPQQIRETWFDFVLRDGQFEPKVIRQQ